MPRSAHAQYEAHLRLLSDDAFVLGALEAAGGLPSGRAWKRCYARFEPAQAPFVTLAFESDEPPPQRLLRVDAFEAEPSDGAAVRTAAGWLKATDFERDPGLPWLPAALAETHGQWSAVRYLPGQRCTLRVSGARGERYVKLFADDVGWREYVGGFAVAQARRELGFDVPGLGAWDAHTRSLWQPALRGAPAVDSLLGPDGEAVARRLGEALATLHDSSTIPVRVFDYRAQMARSIAAMDVLTARVPSLGSDAVDLLERLAGLASGEPAAVHGEAHAEHWLIHGQRPGLVDFRTLAFGDAELDAAVFLAELDADERLQPRAAALQAAFLEGYTRRPRLNGDLLRAYRAHRRLARAVRAAHEVRPDADVAAEAHLVAARAALVG